jgi:hypothetical protein
VYSEHLNSGDIHIDNLRGVGAGMKQTATKGEAEGGNKLAVLLCTL